MAKAAVHQLVKSLAEPNSGLPPGSFCAAILPITLVNIKLIISDKLPNFFSMLH